MPTFFFDTDIEGESLVDTDGVLLPDVRAAKHEARVALCELTAELETDRDLTLATMRVRDGHGDVIATLSLNLLISAPATGVA